MSKARTLELVAIALVSAAGLLLARSTAFEESASACPRPSRRPSPRLRDTRDAAGAPSLGGKARSPAQIPARGWWAVLKRTLIQFNDHRLMNEAGGVVFFVLLGLFPALAALVSLYGLFADPKTVADHLAMLSTVMPAGSMDILDDQLKTAHIERRQHAQLRGALRFRRVALELQPRHEVAVRRAERGLRRA